MKKENSVATQERTPPQEIRERLMSKFERNLERLSPVLQTNRMKEHVTRKRPLVTVIVPLWEEDETMLTFKMFRESLTHLRGQATASGIDLDWIIAANNGGGKTEELGREKVSGLAEKLTKKIGQPGYHEIF